MNIKPARLRGNELLRKAVRETRISESSLILPFFVREGRGVSEEIKSLPGQIRYSPDTLQIGIESALKAGIHSFLIFGLPKEKDELGSGAFREDGVVQQAVKSIKGAFGREAYIITDVCLCGYTKSGHCGIIKKSGEIDSGETLASLAETALSHAFAGADMVAPSDMMDGRVLAIREKLDKNGFSGVPIMSYSAKFSSAFYGPFRDAANSAPKFGDRKTYQMDYHNGNEALKEIILDVSEGADIIMVKPALSYLDVIKAAKEAVKLPVAAYSVSGEYSMIKASAAQGVVDEYGVMCEVSAGIFRAGADILITYFAKELAGAIKRGDIG